VSILRWWKLTLGQRKGGISSKNQETNSQMKNPNFFVDLNNEEEKEMA